MLYECYFRIGNRICKLGNKNTFYDGDGRLGYFKKLIGFIECEVVWFYYFIFCCDIVEKWILVRCC